MRYVDGVLTGLGLNFKSHHVNKQTFARAFQPFFLRRDNRANVN